VNPRGKSKKKWVRKGILTKGTSNKNRETGGFWSKKVGSGPFDLISDQRETEVGEKGGPKSQMVQRKITKNTRKLRRRETL